VRLREVRARLAAAVPDFFSVTYGAGGSTRDKTLATAQVEEIVGEGHAVARTLSVHRRQPPNRWPSFSNSIARAASAVLVALRGDLPSGMMNHGAFRYASELVGFVREHPGDWFHVEVAGYPEMHPQARSPADDLQALATKVRAGASSIITQYFYNVEAFLRFRDEVRAMGLACPVVPGIMPITNFTQLARFRRACGAEIPRWVRVRLASCGDDREAIRAFGLEVVGALCQRLVREGAPSLHFYTLNQAQPSLDLWNACRAA
jgi:methylenetetrahydrofolate reductase (NADPH)